MSYAFVMAKLYSCPAYVKAVYYFFAVVLSPVTHESQCCHVTVRLQNSMLAYTQRTENHINIVHGNMVLY